jgi:hypothetical protein
MRIKHNLLDFTECVDDNQAVNPLETVLVASEKAERKSYKLPWMIVYLYRKSLSLTPSPQKNPKRSLPEKKPLYG